MRSTAALDDKWRRSCWRRPLQPWRVCKRKRKCRQRALLSANSWHANCVFHRHRGIRSIHAAQGFARLYATLLSICWHQHRLADFGTWRSTRVWSFKLRHCRTQKLGNPSFDCCFVQTSSCASCQQGRRLASGSNQIAWCYDIFDADKVQHCECWLASSNCPPQLWLGLQTDRPHKAWNPLCWGLAKLCNTLNVSCLSS